MCEGKPVTRNIDPSYGELIWESNHPNGQNHLVPLHPNHRGHLNLPSLLGLLYLKHQNRMGLSNEERVMRKSSFFLIYLTILSLTSGFLACDQDRKTDQTGKLFRIIQNNKYGYIDKTGKVIIPPQFDQADEFSEGLAAVNQGGVLNNNGVISGGRWGYIDTTGKYVIPLQFDEAGNFSEGLAEVKVNDKYGFIDKTGKMVILPQFEDVWPFSEGLAKVCTDKKYGYIDKTGKITIVPQFDEAGNFSNGLAMVAIGDKFGYIDKTGKFIWRPTK